MGHSQCIIPFENDSTTTTTYQECISFYKCMAEEFPELIFIQEVGMSDVELPIYEVVIGKESKIPEEVRKQKKVVSMIINGIHPGEPDGVDASMLLTKKLLTDKEYSNLLDHQTIVIIPLYNVGGSLRRNNYTRANQNGPREYGFRGNIQNLDLNRDFIKCDSWNAISFTVLFQYWKPEIFIDTHTSDGADYPYTFSLISSQRDKLSPPLADLLYTKMLPALQMMMSQKKDTIVPYVNVKDIPENGIVDFLESPRYSNGYAGLFHSISFLPETHMLKPFPKRVHATNHFLEAVLQYNSRHFDEIIQAKKFAIQYTSSLRDYTLDWKLDETRQDSIDFTVHPAYSYLSPVTQLNMWKYDRTKTIQKKIPFFNKYVSATQVKVPEFYILPQAYFEIVQLLMWNKIKFDRLEQDTCLELFQYKIIDMKTTSDAYENHYLHSDVQLSLIKRRQCFFKGDLLIPTDQFAKRYVIETLEPQAPDSYFAWNFFDGILQRKEYFSDYVFEEKAKELLTNDKNLEREFRKKQEEDPSFRSSNWQQLYWIYQRSNLAEPDFRIYPVGLIFSSEKK